jgi:hypothetical protein
MAKAVPKIKKDQLEKLQNIVNQVNQLQMQIGGLESQKHELLHMIANGKTKLDGLQSDLQKEYGDVSVDIKTGEIKKNESDKKN